MAILRGLQLIGEKEGRVEWKEMVYPVIKYLENEELIVELWKMIDTYWYPVVIIKLDKSQRWLGRSSNLVSCCYLRAENKFIIKSRLFSHLTWLWYSKESQWWRGSILLEDFDWGKSVGTTRSYKINRRREGKGETARSHFWYSVWLLQQQHQHLAFIADY